MEKKSYERIIKAYKYPIALIPENYEYFFELYENILGTKTALLTAEEECKKYSSEEEYFDKMKSLVDVIISSVKESSAFAHFNDAKNEDFFVAKGTHKFAEKVCAFDCTKKTDIYSSYNEGKHFVSVDLETANFQVLRKYDEDLVLGAKTYEEFVGHFCDSKFFSNSKYNRQIIFGNLSAKRQPIMEKYYTGKILDFLLKNNFFKEEELRVYTNDEIVFNMSESVPSSKLKEIYDAIFAEFDLRTHVESFTISEVFPKYFAKIKDNGKISFKGVPTYFLPQVYKKYFGMEIEKRDLMFLYESIPSVFTRTLDGKTI